MVGSIHASLLLTVKIWRWQGKTARQNFGKHPVTPGKAYHNAGFVAKCESVGLHPRLGSGCHWKPADGLFVVLMREYGIAQPEAEEVPKDKPRLDWWDLGKEAKGKSTLTKWQCDCGCNVRVGMKEWPGAVCNRCGNQYHRLDSGVPLTFCDANVAEPRMDWRNHEAGIYRPTIHSERIRELHQVAVLTPSH